jgi:hypothetical protein
MGDTPETSKKRRGFGLQAIARTLPKVTGKALGQRGFAEADLLGQWAGIVGREIAAYCVPRKLDRPRPGQKGEGVLTLRVESGFALELQHLEPAILERINSHFGYRAVGRLRLLQGAAPTTAKNPKADPPLDPESAEALGARLAEVGDDDLRAALDRFGQAVLSRGE